MRALASWAGLLAVALACRASRADELAPATAPTWTAADVVKKVNAYRKIAGLGDVAEDPELSRGCAAHAKYLALNADHAATKGLGAHKEDPSLRGATPEGARAGTASDIAFEDPVASVDGWMATLFHRTPILDPGLLHVGIGGMQSPDGRWFSVMDVSEGKGTVKRAGKGPLVVVYPADKQTDVPVAFGGEVPDPVPQAKGVAGYPITVQFPTGRPLKDVKIVVKDAAGTAIEGWVSTPDAPADARYQRNTLCFIAKAPFAPSSTYTVEASARIGGPAWKRIWTFTTRAAPAAPPGDETQGPSEEK